MKVILLEDVHGVGAAGAVATVSDGYARNLLIPRKLAIPASEGNMKNLERQRETLKRRQAQQASTAELMARKIAGLTITLSAKVGEEGRIYGSITHADIADSARRPGRGSGPPRRLPSPSHQDDRLSRGQRPPAQGH